MTKHSTVSYECRDMRHAWEHANDQITQTVGGNVRTFERHLVCIRCQTQRIDTFIVGARWIGKQKTRYRYAEGYHIKGGIGLPEVRWKLYHNLVEQNRSA